VVEPRNPRRIFMSPHVDGAVYTILQIQHDDPDNDPRAWDWGLVDFSGVTDRRIQVMTVGYWPNDSEWNEEGPWSEHYRPNVHRPMFASMRSTRGRLDR
jgi:hypothetical protein